MSRKVRAQPKVLVIDDEPDLLELLELTLSRMGLDTELNVACEALGAADRALADSIRRVRVSLLAEHCGLLDQAHSIRELQLKRGLVTYLDELASAGRYRLRPLTPELLREENSWVGPLARWGFSLDPTGPLVEEAI